MRPERSLRLGANLEHTSLPGNFPMKIREGERYRRCEILMKYSEEEEIIDREFGLGGCTVQTLHAMLHAKLADHGLQNFEFDIKRSFENHNPK